MGATHLWNGKQIEISSHFSSRYLFLATESVLRVDGREIGRTGGFALTESAIGKIEGENGATHTVEAQVNVSLLNPASSPYVLRVDGIPIGQGHVPFDGIGLAILSYALIAGVLIGGGMIAIQHLR